MPSKNDTSPSSAQQSTAKFIETPDGPYHVFLPLGPISSVPFHISSPTLSIFPHEIRDMIYTHLIAAGETTILRTSKAVFQEASHLLYRQGICRLVFPGKYPNPPRDFLFNKQYAAAVQNLNIRLAMRGLFALDLRTANLFGGSDVCRRNCHFSMENNADSPYAPDEQLIAPEAVLDLLQAFTSFRSMTIRIRFVGSEQMLSLLQSFQSKLEGSLGEGVWCGKEGKDHEEQSLRFCPRAYWERRQERASREG